MFRHVPRILQTLRSASGPLQPVSDLPNSERDESRVLSCGIEKSEFEKFSVASVASAPETTYITQAQSSYVTFQVVVSSEAAK